MKLLKKKINDRIRMYLWKRIVRHPQRLDFKEYQGHYEAGSLHKLFCKELKLDLRRRAQGFKSFAFAAIRRGP